MTPGFGYQQDDPDPRDVRFSDAVPVGFAAAPGAADLSGYVLRVFDQGAAPACVGFAVAQALRVRWCAQIEETRSAAPMTDHDVPLPSALWIWWHARQAAGTERLVVGSKIRNAFRAIVRFGVPEDRWWPSADPRDAAGREPSPMARRCAWDLRGRAGRGAMVNYFRIPDGAMAPALVRWALTHRLPVVFGTDVDTEFAGVRRHLDPLQAPNLGMIAGGHAMVAVGYRPDAVLVVNSWGPAWGNRGLAWLSWPWISGFARDLWAVRAPSPYGVRR